MRENILYLECYSGISGDMTVAALLDLGADEAFLRHCLSALPVDGYEISIGRTKKCGISACDFAVILGEEHHGEEHGHTEHTHVHRTYGMIRKMIEDAPLPEKVKALAEDIFLAVAEAEAKVHESTLEEVHFHEVGAVDSIVDIVGAAACMVNLGIEKVAVSPLYEGKGSVWCQHGRVPVPAPAVLEITARSGLPLVITEQEGEMVTPTGAAIAAALRNTRLPDTFVVEKIGIGAGKKDFPQANILRAMLIVSDTPDKSRDAIEEQKETDASDTVWVLETNVDDCSGEQLGYVIENLMNAGAKDACCFPVYMKKDRPAYMLQVICKEEDVERMESMVFRETTSIGLRKYKEKRTILPRKTEQAQTPWGTVQVKVCRHKGLLFPYPEYDSIRAIGRRTGISYREIYDAAVEGWRSVHGG